MAAGFPKDGKLEDFNVDLRKIILGLETRGTKEDWRDWKFNGFNSEAAKADLVSKAKEELSHLEASALRRDADLQKVIIAEGPSRNQNLSSPGFTPRRECWTPESTTRRHPVHRTGSVSSTRSKVASALSALTWPYVRFLPGSRRNSNRPVSARSDTESIASSDSYLSEQSKAYESFKPRNSRRKNCCIFLLGFSVGVLTVLVVLAAMAVKAKDDGVSLCSRSPGSDFPDPAPLVQGYNFRDGGNRVDEEESTTTPGNFASEATKKGTTQTGISANGLGNGYDVVGTQSPSTHQHSTTVKPEMKSITTPGSSHDHPKSGNITTTNMAPTGPIHSSQTSSTNPLLESHYTSETPYKASSAPSSPSYSTDEPSGEPTVNIQDQLGGVHTTTEQGIKIERKSTIAPSRDQNESTWKPTTKTNLHAFRTTTTESSTTTKSKERGGSYGIDSGLVPNNENNNENGSQHNRTEFQTTKKPTNMGKPPTNGNEKEVSVQPAIGKQTPTTTQQPKLDPGKNGGRALENANVTPTSSGAGGIRITLEAVPSKDGKKKEGWFSRMYQKIKKFVKKINPF